MAQERPARDTMTADELLAVSSRVVDCEGKAATQYDNGSYTISQLARRIMGVCAVELTKARLAFGLSLNDPQIESDEFKRAVEAVENARKSRAKGK